MPAIRSARNFTTNFFFFMLLAGFSVGGIFAASTGNSAILQQNGRGAALQDGDYATESGWVHRFFIEAPSGGLTRLRVQLFDADIGRGSFGGSYDYQAGGSWNTSCTYTLYNPSGTAVASFTGNQSNGTDNDWITLYDTVAAPIPRGHWRLEVNMTGTIGDDTNAYGIRADDGSSSSAGTELNIYAYSFVPLGRMSSTLYPWVTSGCTVDYNDFDGDGTNAISYSSRTGNVSGSYSGSANNAWLNRPISFLDDYHSVEAGLWSATNALSGTNINNFYAGDFSAANPPPSGQPESGTFRIYFPRDGGGKPSKPVVTQKLSFVSGANPPATGSTSRVRIEVAVNNPAARAITFSGSNTLTAYVPGDGVIYAGNAVCSQGSIVSQPAIGGTGNITWDPGTVSAGSTVTLSYQVDATPPSASRLSVTGTPSANGTTAVYLDETGQLTYTFGPLCDLAVAAGSDIPTWAAVTRFGTCSDGGQPTVEWHTGMETGTIGYNLWRQDRNTGEYEQVNPMLLPALANAPQGGVYRLADPGAFSFEPVTYRLEEIDVRGRSLLHGPFTVAFGGGSGQDTLDREPRLAQEEPSDIHGFQRFRRGQSLYEEGRVQARQRELLQATLQAKEGKDRARVTVKGQGLFYVSAGQVASSLGMSDSLAASLISAHNLKLTTLGKECAWLADANGAGLFFYNEGLETVFSDRNVYFLERGNGLGMEAISGGSAGPVSGQSYIDSRHFEGNQYAVLLSSMDPAGDLWFWDYVVAGAAVKTFAVEVPGAAPGRATLNISLQGATDTGAENDHHAVISLNGIEIGEGTWGGTAAHEIEIGFDAGLLRDGANAVTVGGMLDTGAPYSTFYVESFDLSYPRYYQAAANSIICRADGNSVITVSGLTELQTAVLDVSTPRRPLLLTGVAPDVAGRVTFVPQSSDREYLVSGLNAAQRPVSVVGDRPSPLKGRAKAAEYIVIAPEEFADAAQELADYRRGKGLKTLVVTLEDIYDAFSYGVTDPYAIRAFLAYASKNWGKVKYAVLAGKGTYDYNDYLGNGDNLVPVLLGRTPEGLCASDRIYGDMRGRDGLPEIAVGRLPAITKAELAAMVAKIKAYEEGQGDWTEKALFIADNADSGGDFAAGCDELAALAAGYTAEKYYLTGSAAAIKNGVIASWNAGGALAAYCGHGGINQLAAENLLDVDDAAGLANGGRLPLALLFTCAAGRFELPGFTSLGEALALNGGGGMAGGLAPSGAALHEDSLRLGTEFYRAAIHGQAENAGTALLAAMRNYLLQGGKPSLLNAYNWIGDPALKIK